MLRCVRMGPNAWNVLYTTTRPVKPAEFMAESTLWQRERQKCSLDSEAKAAANLRKLYPNRKRRMNHLCASLGSICSDGEWIHDCCLPFGFWYWILKGKNAFNPPSTKFNLHWWTALLTQWDQMAKQGHPGLIQELIKWPINHDPIIMQGTTPCSENWNMTSSMPFAEVVLVTLLMVQDEMCSLESCSVGGRNTWSWRMIRSVLGSHSHKTVHWCNVTEEVA